MMIITWTIQIRGISFDSTVVTCSDPFVVQNDIKLIRATYFSKFHCDYSSKTNELWMSQATRFLHDMRFYFKFLTFKSQEFTIKLPQKKSQSSGKKQTPAYPDKSYNLMFSNSPDHIIVCKTYDKCNVIEKFWTLHYFTRKQKMPDVSRKSML